jgi:tape measure domain-containing protein
MADRAKFTVQLIDKVSGGARSANRSVGSLLSKLSHVGKVGSSASAGLRSFRSGLDGGARSAGRFGGALDVFKGNLLTMAATKLASVGTAAVSAGFSMVTFGQNSRLAFDSLAKHGVKGEQLFEHARELAKRFGLDVMDTTDAYKKFLSLQFDPGAIDDLIRMGADLRMLGADAEGVQGVFLALGQIKGKGKLQMEELTGQLGERGIATEIVVANVGKLLGGKDNDAVRKMIAAGKVDAVVGIKAVQMAVMQKLQESKLGEAGAKFADNTIDGMMGRFKAFGQDAGLTMFDKAAAPITKALGGALNKLISFVESPAGGVLIEKLAKSIERLAIAGAEFGGELAEKFINADWAAIGRDVVAIAQGMIAAAKAGVQLASVLGIGNGKHDTSKPLAEDRASVMGFAAAGAATGALAGSIVPGIGTALGGLAGGVAGASLAALENAGMSMGLWMSSGIESDVAKAAARDAGMTLGNSVSGGMIDALEIHSPSRVTMRMGKQLGAGLAIGMDRSSRWASQSGTDLANASLDGMYGAPSALPSFGDAGSSSAGSGPFSLNLTQHIDGSGKDAEEIGRIAARETRREVESFFRQLAMET